MISEDSVSGKLLPLKDTLSQISISPRTKRGPLFEEFFSLLMKALGCEIYPPKDRETDRVVEFHGQYFKVECRYKSNGELTAAEIREFTNRVQAGPANVVGILATNSVPTGAAPRYIGRATPHQVLIMDITDIEGLLSGNEDFADFLRRNNVAAAGGRIPSLAITVPKRSRKDYSGSLVANEAPTLLIDGKPDHYLTNRAKGPECLVFTPIFYRGSERSYVLEASPYSCEKSSDLARILYEFGQTFGGTSAAAFTLTQNQWSWHGFGAREFLKCLRERQIRYKRVDLEEYHHSETALFVDEVRMGGGRDCLFWLSAQPSTTGDVLSYVYCGFMFSELPFDTRSFQRFFESIGPIPDGYSTWEGDVAKHFRVSKDHEIKPLGYVLSPDRPETWVQGLLTASTQIKFDARSLDSKGHAESEGWVGEALSKSRIWISELRGWHELRHQPAPQYEMVSIRTVDIPAPGFGGAIVDIMIGSVFH